MNMCVEVGHVHKIDACVCRWHRSCFMCLSHMPVLCDGGQPSETVFMATSFHKMCRRFKFKGSILFKGVSSSSSKKNSM